MATEVTIYNDGFAVLKERRELFLPRGRSETRWEGVPRTLDPATVSFSAPGTSTLEQNFRFDLVSRDAILEKHLGRDVVLVDERRLPDGGTISRRIVGRILSVEGGRISALATAEGILIDPPGRIDVSSLPDGLSSLPYLSFSTLSSKELRGEAEMRCLCAGFTWKSEYVLVLGAEGDSADLDGLVSLTNTSGAVVRDARLKLVAGDVSRYRDPKPKPKRKVPMRDEIPVGRVSIPIKAPPQFKAQRLFEHHMYSLERPTDILDNETKQISLFSAQGLEVRTRVVFDLELGRKRKWWLGTPGIFQWCACAEVLEIENLEKNRLGRPLPRGEVKLYRRDSQGGLHQLGTDLIDHTPKGETIRLVLGKRSEILVNRRELSRRSEPDHSLETIKVVLWNSSHRAQVVEIVEHRNSVRWSVLESSRPVRRISSSEWVISVEVPAREEVRMEYVVEEFA